jgi:hypothetical protein
MFAAKDDRERCGMRLKIAALAIVTALAPMAASAQTFVRADCRAVVAAPALRFDDGEHRLWYRRFWNGDCGPLSFCSPGEPNWNLAVGQIIQRAPAARRSSIRARACRIGRVIGFEWSRDNSIRKIDTGQLSDFYAELDGATDIEAALAQIEQQAHADLGQ